MQVLIFVILTIIKLSVTRCRELPTALCLVNSYVYAIIVMEIEFILLRQHIDAHIKALIHVLRDQIRHRGSVIIAVISAKRVKMILK